MRPYYLVSSAGLFLPMCSLLAQQGVIQHADALRSTTLELKSSDPRPLRDLARQLEKHFGLRVPYEETLLAADESLVDAVPSHVKASRPEAVFLVPRSKPVSVTLTIDPKLEKSDRSRLAVEQVFDAFQRSGNQGFFRLHVNGDLALILPTAFKEKGGEIRAFEPLLDTPVSIPEGRRRVGEIVRLILQDVSQKREYAIAEGLTPTNLFQGRTVLFSAENEPARSALLRLFGDVGIWYTSAGFLPPRVSWALIYSPDEDQFYFNAHLVREPIEERQTPFFPRGIAPVPAR